MKTSAASGAAGWPACSGDGRWKTISASSCCSCWRRRCWARFWDWPTTCCGRCAAAFPICWACATRCSACAWRRGWWAFSCRRRTGNCGCISCWGRWRGRYCISPCAARCCGRSGAFGWTRRCWRCACACFRRWRRKKFCKNRCSGRKKSFIFG